MRAKAAVGTVPEISKRRLQRFGIDELAVGADWLQDGGEWDAGNEEE